MKLKEYNFGFVDSEKELKRYPKIIEDAFYDPKGILQRLLDEHEFILIGNKGVGKTAYSAKIRTMVNTKEVKKAKLVTLSNLEFNLFDGLGRENVEGGQKYKIAWELIILIEVYKTLHESQDYTSVDEFNDIISFLNKNNIIKKKSSINNTLINWNNIEINFWNTFKLNREKQDIGLNEYTQGALCDYMKEGLNKIHFEEESTYLIIDGLDDILRYEKSKIEILSGLLRTINLLNDYFYDNEINFKIIILVREDILTGMIDPDFNKIKRDSGIILSWINDKDLFEIVKLRFLLSGVEKEKVHNRWYEIFPEKINNRVDSFKYVLNNTLYKPRDILQFLEQCKKEFPEEKSLNYSKLRHVIKQYSNNYFYEEMKNELSGFIKDEDIDNLIHVFARIGDVHFTYTRFKTNAEQFFSNTGEDYIKKVFNILFDNGYIGQVVLTPRFNKNTKKSTYNKNIHFKYTHPTTKINTANKFVLHRGIINVLDIN